MIVAFAMAAHASDCTDGACDIEPMRPAVSDMNAAIVPLAPIVDDAAVSQKYIYPTNIPTRSVKLFSVKPIEHDSRPALWDGTHGKYKSRAYDKTVDWHTGIPIWDDSIANPYDKDFSDWFLEPLPELYTDDAIALYNQNMADAAATRARVEELLSPQRPTENLWTDDAIFAPRHEYVQQDMSEIVRATFGTDDGCPFDTDDECEIWRRKPVMREIVAPRSSQIRNANMADFISAARYIGNIDATHSAAAPLVARYKMLMNASRACCTDGMVYSLKRAGASDGLVYKFMADDANFYGLGTRCLMMTDEELDSKYPNTSTAVVAADVRNGCLCRGRQWFTAMLAPFVQAYDAMPEFANQKFHYTYTDGLGRVSTVSINNDVQNVLNQLEQCP